MGPPVLAVCRGSPRGAVRLTFDLSQYNLNRAYRYYGGIACAISPLGAGWRKGGESLRKEIFSRA